MMSIDFRALKGPADSDRTWWPPEETRARSEEWAPKTNGAGLGQMLAGVTGTDYHPSNQTGPQIGETSEAGQISQGGVSAVRHAEQYPS